MRKILRSRVLVLLGLLVAAATLGACSEKLDEGNSCPLLCPQAPVQLQQVVIDGVLVDSTVPGFPPIGAATTMLLAARADTFDTRVIVRFDTLVQTYRAPQATTDSTINHVDSARFQIVLDTTKITGLPALPRRPFTIELYDVDTPVSDTVAADLLPLFTQSRFLGSRTFNPDSLTDTLRVPVLPVAVLRSVLAGTHLRLGVKLVSDTSASVRLLTGGTTLRFWPATDTSVIVSPTSKTPTDSTQTALRTRLDQYVIVAKGPPMPAPGQIAVGGYPASRTYLRFDIPRALFDSATIVRASLILTQIPNPASPVAGDSVTIFPVPITAGTVLTDIPRLLNLASFIPGMGVDSLRVVPLGSGPRRVELVSLVRVWRSASTSTTNAPAQHAIALRLALEGQTGAQALFYSTEAGAQLRPKLEITYAPRASFGLP